MRHFEALEPLAAHAKNGRWIDAVVVARNYRRCTDPWQLLANLQLAHEMAWIVTRGGVRLRRELQRIFTTENFAPTEDYFPGMFSFILFESALEQLGGAVAAGNWPRCCQLLRFLLDLPGANPSRTVDLKGAVQQLTERAHFAQRQLMERFPLVTSPAIPAGAVWRATQEKTFPLPWLGKFAEVLASSDCYPTLAADYVVGLLSGAEWPILAYVDGPLLSATWPTEIYPTRLSDTAREWLRRRTVLGAEPYAPGEFQEDP